MSYVPYPMPPKMRGTVENPGRQASPLQAVALLAGFVLLLAIGFAFTVDSAAAELAVAAGCAGLLLGATGFALATRRRDIPHR